MCRVAHLILLCIDPVKFKCRYEDLEDEWGLGYAKARQGMGVVSMRHQWVLTDLTVSVAADDVLAERTVAPWHMFDERLFDGFIEVGARIIQDSLTAVILSIICT